MKALVSREEIERLVRLEHSDPFSILGIHPVEIEDDGTGRSVKAVVVRAFLPEAREAWVSLEGPKDNLQMMERIHPEGIFELLFLDRRDLFAYQIRMQDHEGKFSQFVDPYCFPPVLTDFDLYLMGEGNHFKKYEKLGAHLKTINGVSGVQFAVWAPNALRVSVIGDFNNWDGRRHTMRMRGSSGIWELFIPGLEEGLLYKFEIKSRHNNLLLIKSDPYGFYFEKSPKTSTIIYDLHDYEWQDQSWMEKRTHTNWLEAPLAIYEIHLGSWMRSPEEGNRYLTYRELADRLIPYMQKMGFTHIQLLPISEHPFDGSWGYQTIGYFAPTSRFGKPEDFMEFVDRFHQAGIGVLLDWVPAHFPKDAHGLAFFDGTNLYEHADPRKGEHRDWGTLIFNYGRNEVRNFLISNALFWLEKYHIDGLRVDAVASMLYLDYSRPAGEWIPNQYGSNENLEAIEFIKKFNELTCHFFPGILNIAEESTAWPAVSRPVYLGGLGFSLKWNMGWMNDMLEIFSKDPIYRKFYHNNLTFALMYAFTENFVLPLSHDEVVYGKRSLLNKMPGYFHDRFSNLRLLLAYMYGQPGKKLLFMGGEFGQWREWNHDASLDWHLLEYEPHQQVQRFVQDLNRLYVSQPSLYEIDFHYRGFEWIDFHDSDRSIVSFLRRGKNPSDFLVFVYNFTPLHREGYRIGVPVGGFYQELLNSDSSIYGGRNFGNAGGLPADEIPWQGRPYSLQLTVPPLAVTVLKPSS
ncbi:MAG TPA: 1,4-alpha-glucan branching protein GlgB [Terriglobia bacterium]|nr:1,4-alpha-glucan branching protein GlgB [Terriglobia bacterium]